MGFLDKLIPILEGKDAERFLEIIRENEEGVNKIDFSEQIKAFEKMKNSNLYIKKDLKDFVKEYPIEELSEFGDDQVQDILDDMGMTDTDENKPDMVNKQEFIEKTCQWLKAHIKIETISYNDIWDISVVDILATDFNTVDEMEKSFRKIMEE